MLLLAFVLLLNKHWLFFFLSEKEKKFDKKKNFLPFDEVIQWIFYLCIVTICIQPEVFLLFAPSYN